MKTTYLIYVTFPDEGVAKSIAGEVIESRLAACANILPSHHSYYWWDGEVQSEQEVAAIFKTSGDTYNELEQCIKRLHPYDVPCIVALPIEKGYDPFLKWVQDQTK